ncbi:MAG: multiprotein-bridging factor 1 family protein [Thermoplasmata archaeon]|nr:multiprotein-bridging factor 1 family protein [Thermoplasmata archaeon]MCI4356925.1 multiprotein-bridging factor 1 family protein [Thermoplasmata archaeon]
MLCEMCGEDVPATTATRVEGSTLQLCPNCSRFGVVVAPPIVPAGAAPPSDRGGSGLRPMVRTNRGVAERDLYAEMPEMELAADWGKRIRVAREALTWSPEELGKRLNEKKSVILKMEAGSFRPPDGMIRKVEHLLRVRLRADPEPSV